MLTIAEKNKIKEILAEGLNINKNINFPYFLDCIQQTSKDVKNLESRINQILYQQKILEQKIDMLINAINNKK